MLPGKVVSSAVVLLAFPLTLAAQVTLVSPRTGATLAQPTVVASVAFDPTTKVADLSGVQIRRDLIGISLRWHHAEPTITHMTTIALGSSNWIPGSYSVRFEIPSVPVPLQVIRYWYVGSTRESQSCTLQPGPGVCDLPFTVESASGTIWFEIRPLDSRQGFDTAFGKMTVSRLASPTLRTMP
ncbi:MAG TPA: hypothetical protein VJ672_16565 [Gemmatimonadaceae bacterium]|nr:hypothetical protein [Gemmatimonadaceae bacterium]